MADGSPPPLEAPVDDERTSGEVIAGRFRIERPIARGGMAEVFLAEQIGLRRKVALKILAPRSTDDNDDFQERFRLEAETLASLNHPNIVTLHDYGQTQNGRFYLAMEFVDGPRFTDLLKEGPFEPRRAIDLVLQICEALRYAHKRNVIHRDLKPSNLLVSLEDGKEHVKVVDFGLARLTDEQGITRSGMILGSPHCMSPEAVSGAEIDARADIYSLGILLFRTITGHYPFHGATSAATMIAHMNRPTPTFFSVAPDLQVPSGLEDVVRRCLEKEPAVRYPDVKALAAALRECRAVAPELFEPVNLTHTVVTRQLKSADRRDQWKRFIPGVFVGVVAAAVAAVVVQLNTPGAAVDAGATEVVTPQVQEVIPEPAPIEPEEAPEGEATDEEAGEEADEGAADEASEEPEAPEGDVAEEPVVEEGTTQAEPVVAPVVAPVVTPTPEPTPPVVEPPPPDGDNTVDEIMPNPY